MDLAMLQTLRGVGSFLALAAVIAVGAAAPSQQTRAQDGVYQADDN
jgi:hypothetical protein